MRGSSIQPIIRFLMLLHQRMRKVKLLELLIEVDPKMLLTKDGRSSMLIKLIRLELRASTKNLDSTSTDHST
jgi:hypothetical protein